MPTGDANEWLVNEQLSERAPVFILLTDDPNLDEYCQELLNPKTLQDYAVPELSDKKADNEK